MEEMTGERKEFQFEIIRYIYCSKLHTIHNNLRIILIGISIVRKLEAHKQTEC